MTRRGFLSRMPILGAIVPTALAPNPKTGTARNPKNGAARNPNTPAHILDAPSASESTQFEVSGPFTLAGLESEGYYAIGIHAAIYLDPRYVPAMKAQADRLVGKQARLRLEEA
jgi:hypothetical protein